MVDSIMVMGKDPTIKDFILKFNSDDFIISNFFLKQVITLPDNKKMLINLQNLVTKYMPELKELKIKIGLSNEEYAKYKYNPKVLSYDVYGTTELWFLILEANELHSITEFNLKTIYLFRTDIIDKLSRIINLEVTSKNYNEEEIAAELMK